ncbi:hypothetical protein A4X06_0g2339 [Tilletia controversa]|uniref:Uncharacterized protein n=1 Tax=Tilletia controversa TaxID=13291 RepID=A0A8X7SYN4_9BASI|nr:hypothetical protein CF328_g1842 [Tilletia controversa]KAE8252235.1 hypothetical protein A4X06_0g2339 [Tilletia controversa]
MAQVVTSATSYLHDVVAVLSGVAHQWVAPDPTLSLAAVAPPPAWFSAWTSAPPALAALSLQNTRLHAVAEAVAAQAPSLQAQWSNTNASIISPLSGSNISDEYHALATASETLLTLRFAQLAVLLLIPLIAVLHNPVSALLSHMLHPRRSAYQEADQQEPASGASPNPLDAAAQPVAIRVPIRTPRRQLMHFSILVIAATYVLSGILIILRAVLPPPSSRLWQPDLPLWYGLDISDLGALLGWALLSVVCLWEERKLGKFKYSKNKVYWATILGSATDLAILVVYLSVRGEKLQLLAPWTAAQLVIVLLRIVLFYPLLFFSLVNDRVRFLLASEAEARERNSSPSDHGGGQTTSSARSLTGSVNEATGLLQPPSTANSDSNRNGGYGATASTSNNTATGNGLAADAGTRSGVDTPSGYRTPSKRPSSTTLSQAANSTAAPAAQAANASMGLSVTSSPPPPTFRVFAHRLRALFPYLWPWNSHRLQFYAGICFILLLCERVVNLLVPLQLGKIIDSLGGDGVGPQEPWIPVLVYAGLKMLRGSGGIIQASQSLLWLPVEQYSERMMSLMAFEHLLNLSMRFHTKRRTGEVLRILDRGASINSFFDMLIFRFFPIFLDLTIAVIWLTKTFALAVGISLLAIMLVYTYMSVKLTTWRTELRREANNKDSVSRAIHTDVLMNWETVKFYSNEHFEAERYRLSLLDYQAASAKVLISLSALNFLQNTVLSVGTLGMTLLVAHRVVRGQARPAEFVVFLTYLSQAFGPLSMLGTLYRVIQQNLVDTDKLMSLLEEETDIKDLPDAKDLVVTDGVIEFRDVHFSYDGKNEAIQGLSFVLDPKSSAALVGESGAGKSSVLRLLYRFYDIQRGQILIDGQDIKTVTQRSLRRAIGIVPQEPSLFNTSIRHNIHYGNTEEATDEAIQAAAEAAQIWDRIQTFSKGMQEVVGERGVRLSGGEKQRVAIARTILKNPPILLLDEATSALDSLTERQLQGALGTVMQGRTSLTIAHRLSTIINVDIIIVMEAGRVVEQGSHIELLERKGKYHKLWMQQIQTQKEQEAALEAAAAVTVDGEAALEDSTEFTNVGGQIQIPTVQIIAGTPLPDSGFRSLESGPETNGDKGKQTVSNADSPSPELFVFSANNGHANGHSRREASVGLGLDTSIIQRTSEAIDEAHATNSDKPLLTPSSDVGERPFIITSPPVEESGSRTPSSAEIKQALRSRATTISAPGTPALEAASPRTMRQRIASFASRVGRRSVSSQNSPLLGPSPSVGVGETFSKVQESTTGAITPPTTESTTSLTLEGSSVAPTTPTKAYPPSDDQEPALVNGHSREETEGAKSQIEEEEGHERNDSVNGVANASPSGQGKWSNKNKKRRQKKKNGSSVA